MRGVQAGRHQILDDSVQSTEITQVGGDDGNVRFALAQCKSDSDFGVSVKSKSHTDTAATAATSDPLLVQQLMERVIRLEAEARQLLLDSMDHGVARTLLLADRNGASSVEFRMFTSIVEEYGIKKRDTSNAQFKYATSKPSDQTTPTFSLNGEARTSYTTRTSRIPNRARIQNSNNKGMNKSIIRVLINSSKSSDIAIPLLKSSCWVRYCKD